MSSSGQSKLNAVLSADNTTGHVASATVIGGALSSVVCWALQLAHVMPTPEVEASFGVLFAVGASWLMQRMGE